MQKIKVCIFQHWSQEDFQLFMRTTVFFNISERLILWVMTDSSMKTKFHIVKQTLNSWLRNFRHCSDQVTCTLLHVFLVQFYDEELKEVVD